MSRIIKIRDVEIGTGKPKICVSVMGRDEQEMIGLTEKADRGPCDIIELRADYFDELGDSGRVKSLLRKVRRTTSKPIIFTVRSEAEGGRADITPEYYKELLAMAASSKLADLIDAEYSSAGDPDFINSLKDSGAYVIVSRHDFSKTPEAEEILSTFREMNDCGADIAKAAYMPFSRQDVLNMINAACEMTSDLSRCAVIAISMGRLGVITRLMGEFMGSVITFASMGQVSAPGQIDAEEMSRALDVIHNNTVKVLLVGYIGTGKTAVANALSHNYGLKKIDLNAYIEKKEQLTISDLARYDMELFLDKETKYFRKVLKKDVQVISVGTGVALRPENIELMKQSGLIVLLTASPETIAKRLENDPGRSTINHAVDCESLDRLMKDAMGVYEDIADLKISTDDKTAEQVGREIVETLGFTM